jgi:acyl-coenzyme A thioesterase PaaI-like protein
MLATIADTAIGMLLIQEDRNGNPSVTVSLTLDYLSGASLGDWVECHVDYDKIGANLRFATCRVMVGERMVLKANAVFAVSPIPHVISRRTGDSSFREYLTTFGKI